MQWASAETSMTLCRPLPASMEGTEPFPNSHGCWVFSGVRDLRWGRPHGVPPRPRTTRPRRGQPSSAGILVWNKQSQGEEGTKVLHSPAPRVSCFLRGGSPPLPERPPLKLSHHTSASLPGAPGPTAPGQHAPAPARPSAHPYSCPMACPHTP